MTINFIGIGGAFDVNFINSSAIVSLNGKKYLIDCGHSVFPQLVKLNLIQDIDGVLITHLHDDHVGSISTLGFYCLHILGKKLNILLPDHEVFHQKVRQFFGLTIVKYEDYLNFVLIDDSTCIQSITTTNLHYPGMETFSYIFEEGAHVIAYSGDLGNANFLFEEIKKRKMLSDNLTVFHDTSFSKNTAHAYYKELMNWQKEFNIYSYHCNPDNNPPDNTLPLVYNSDFFIR